MGPALAAWMGDAAARAKTRAIVSAFARGWARDTPLPALACALDRLAEPTAEEVAAHVRPLLEDAGWAEAIVARLVAEVRRDPFFEPPLVPLHSDVQAGLLLYAGRHAVIGLGVGALDRMAAKKRRRIDGSIAFPGHASLIRALRGGGATLSLWTGGWRDGAPLDRCQAAGIHRLRDGELIAVDGRTTSFLVDHARSDMLLLHATILAGTAPTACEYDRATLRLTATGAASERASRTQLLTTLLAALDRPDADAFGAASRAAEPFVRWHALREWLALDADAAARRLDEMAQADPDPELRALARTAAASIPCPA
ncbi:hypothetical protein HZF05_12545 [Sphingomonas sp. CGMCC 1.13654]|uniref:Uncharacterized protein n=1 Tax=Sphingomonas chungangi TaxID=2683589 RepID=A0A838L7B9_9SPHN|nr:hypothetical protein [Sphingomonas chungangi]MBA2934927.1 hypothetical protein [Sphingomonas chungangi]MVW58238.1 hypothetical protein [Sphingomonas chungangi]